MCNGFEISYFYLINHIELFSKTICKGKQKNLKQKDSRVCISIHISAYH